MRVLLIKTSSMGDIIHTLPALTDATQALKNIQFDWVVEDAFADIPYWHPSVERVIPVALRRWRKGLFSRETRFGWSSLKKDLERDGGYDIILDAQGLVKSAILTLLAKGHRTGLDFKSARESLASFAYQTKCTVNFYQHAVLRMRSLFSQALHYPLPDTPPQFELQRTRFFAQNDEDYLVFLHGTTWITKQWPEAYWIKLGDLAHQAGLRVKISGGHLAEMDRAERIARKSQGIDLLPYLSIKQMASLLANARVVVAVDTGFGHLAAALDVPTVSIYGPTDPTYTGALGARSHHLAAQFKCAPCMQRQCTYRGQLSEFPACFTTVSPELVWAQVEKMVSS